MNIVLTGSLGNISQPLAKILVQQGHSVTLISSNPDKQSAIEALGATAAIGSIEDPGFLTKTFAGADAVYLMTPFKMTEADQLAYFKRVSDNYVEAIRRNGIKRVVNLSGWCAHLVRSGNLESTLDDQLSGAAITHLRPGSFYSNFYGFKGMIKTQGVIAGNYGGEDKIVLVAPSDIAAAAAEELAAALPAKKVRYVGSDELTCNEAAAILGKAIGKPDLQWIIVTDEQMRQGLTAMGMPAQLTDLLVEMQSLTHQGLPQKDYFLNRPVPGKIKMTEFAEEFAAFYLKD